MSVTVFPFILNTIPKKSIVLTDEFCMYRLLCGTHYHLKVNHKAKQYINSMAHTNGIENFWSYLKMRIDGIYH